jgi:hypothetical protein
MVRGPGVDWAGQCRRNGGVGNFMPYQLPTGSVPRGCGGNSVVSHRGQAGASDSLKLWRRLENLGKMKDSTSIMDLELFMPSQDTVLVKGIAPSQLQDASSGSTLSVEQLVWGFPRVKPRATKCFQKPFLSAGLSRWRDFAGPRGTTYVGF